MSNNAIRWTLDEKNPVIRPGQLHPGLDDDHAGAGHVVRLGDAYRMYYWGVGPEGKVILMAESSVEAPNEWTPAGGVLLAREPDTDYNCNGPSFPFVLPVEGDRWCMYFGAWGRGREDGRLPNTTGLAVSDDAGLTWRYHPENPIIPLDRPWDRCGTGSVSVVRVGGELRMYYTSIKEYFERPAGVRTGHGDVIPRIGIGYAVSRDGVRWEKPLDDFMVAPRGAGAEPYEYICSKPCVIRDGDAWRMWVSTFGPAYRVRSLTSANGLDWSWNASDADGDLGVGAPGAFDDVQRSYASVVRHGDEYRMWYTGNGFGRTGMGYAVGIPPSPAQRR